MASMAGGIDRDFVIDRRGQRMSKESKTAATARAVRSGTAVSQKKFAAGENKAHGLISNARKLEEDETSVAVPTVSMNLSKAIMQGRQAKSMTQKDLALKIGVKAPIIQSYENGKAIPDPGVLVKIERALGVKLPRNKKK